MVPPPVSSSLTNTDSGTEGQTSLSHPPRATYKVPEGSFDSLQSPFPTALFLRDLESKEGNGQREHVGPCTWRNTALSHPVFCTKPYKPQDSAVDSSTLDQSRPLQK